MQCCSLTTQLGSRYLASMKQQSHTPLWLAGLLALALLCASSSDGAAVVGAEQCPEAKRSPSAPGEPRRTAGPGEGRAAPAAALGIVEKHTPLILEHLVLEKFRERWKNAWKGGELQRRLAASRAKYGNLSVPRSDMVGQICRTTAFFKEAGEAYVLATDENLQAYMEACREVYHEVPSQVRAHVEGLWRREKLRDNIVERIGPPPPIAKGGGGQCGAAWREKTDEELREELGADAEPYFREGLRPLQERILELSEAGEAFGRGEVARFDARKVLPAAVFNITLWDLRNQHTETAMQVPVLNGVNHGHWPRCQAPLERLPDFIQKFGLKHEAMQVVIRAFLPWILETQCNASHKLGDVVHWATDDLHVPFEYYYDQPEETKQLWRNLSEAFRVLGPSAINLRRLPNFPGSQVDYARLVGLEDVVETTHNFLWLSVSRGIFHCDVYDNVFIQLTGRADVQVVPSNCSRLIFERHIEVNQGTFSLLQQQLPQGAKSCAPFFHLRLHPGDGVVIPSGTYHKIITRGSDRLSINSFFEPKFGQMLWSGNPSNLFARNHPDVRATRSFWLKVVAHLWRERKLAMFYHSPRNEWIV